MNSISNDSKRISWLRLHRLRISRLRLYCPKLSRIRSRRLRLKRLRLHRKRLSRFEVEGWDRVGRSEIYILLYESLKVRFYSILSLSQSMCSDSLTANPNELGFSRQL